MFLYLASSSILTNYCGQREREREREREERERERERERGERERERERENTGWRVIRLGPSLSVLC